MSRPRPNPLEVKRRLQAKALCSLGFVLRTWTGGRKIFVPARKIEEHHKTRMFGIRPYDDIEGCYWADEVNDELIHFLQAASTKGQVARL